MRVPLLVATLLLASLGAGCLGSPGKSMTLRDGLADAEDAAKAWADGKEFQLIGAAAVEPFKHLNETSDDGKRRTEIVTHLDPVSGDGEAPGWAYGFATEDRCIAIVLAAGLGVLAEGYTTCDADDVEPLPVWSLDSDDVAALLLARADWPKPGEGTTYFWELMADEGVPTWSVSAEGPDGASAWARVHAGNGTVLSLRTRDSLEPAPVRVDVAQPGEPGEGAGHGTDTESDSSTLMQPGATIGSQMRLAGPGLLEVQVSAEQVVGSLRVRVVGPAGEVVSAEVPAGGFHEVYEVPAGEYKVEVTAGTLALLVKETVTGIW